MKFHQVRLGMILLHIGGRRQEVIARQHDHIRVRTIEDWPSEYTMKKHMSDFSTWEPDVAYMNREKMKKALGL